MKKISTALIPQHIQDDAAQLTPEEFNAKRYQLTAKEDATGKKHALHVRVVDDELRLYISLPAALR